MARKVPACNRGACAIDFLMERDEHKMQTYRYIALAALIILSIFFWHSIVLMPVKLFVVFLHELSHAMAAIMTGGSVERIEINQSMGGLAVTRGGWGWLVVSSGYVGSMLLGALILLASVQKRGPRVLAGSIGVLVLVVTALFIRNAFGIIFGALFGLAMLLAARRLHEDWLTVTLQYLGAMSCLYALVDVKEDLLTLEHRVTDASIMASATGIPAIVWGISWSLLALLVFVVVLRMIWRKHKAEGNNAP
jgi:hypothetical protein